jgi:hypothetical protein
MKCGRYTLNTLKAFLKNGLKIVEKSYKNHLRSNNYEVCTAVARCFPNDLDVMVLGNVNLSSDKIGQPLLQQVRSSVNVPYIPRTRRQVKSISP